MDRVESSPIYEAEKKTDIKVHGQFGWNELQVVMSRSTTPDLIKMMGKLQDFFNQQQRSGMHALSGSRPLASASNYPSSRGHERSVFKKSQLKDEKDNGADEEHKNDGSLKCCFHYSCNCSDIAVSLIAFLTSIDLTRFRAFNKGRFCNNSEISTLSSKCKSVENKAKLSQLETKAAQNSPFYFTLGTGVFIYSEHSAVFRTCYIILLI